MALYVALTHEQASFLLERLGVMEADFEARLQNLCPDYLKTPEAQESYVASVFSVRHLYVRAVLIVISSMPYFLQTVISCHIGIFKFSRINSPSFSLI